jgi:predicted nucleic acid-binding protein
MTLVVDANVVAKWNFPEEHSQAARRLLRGRDLCVPDLLWAEFGNIVWKKWRRQEITAEEGRSIVQDLRKYTFRVFVSDRLRIGAWEIASRFNRSFYDSLYLALAIQEDCPLVTADHKLYNALLGTSLATRLVWVADIP